MVGQASVPASSRRQGRLRHRTRDFFTNSTVRGPASLVLDLGEFPYRRFRFARDAK